MNDAIAADANNSGYVRERISATVQVRPYEPMTVEVDIAVPLGDRDPAEAYDELHALVASRIRERILELRAYKAGTIVASN